jgi:hypothetical protein
LKRKGVQLKLWRKKLALCVPRENKSGTITKKIKTKKKREKKYIKKMDHKSRNEVTSPPCIAMEGISHRDDSNNTKRGHR